MVAIKICQISFHSFTSFAFFLQYCLIQFMILGKIIILSQYIDIKTIDSSRGVSK